MTASKSHDINCRMYDDGLMCTCGAGKAAILRARKAPRRRPRPTRHIVQTIMLSLEEIKALYSDGSPHR